MARQSFSYQCLSLNIPSSLYQNINYYHDGKFADDRYRRPWTRVSVDSTQLLMDFSVLDYWKGCLCVEDFLEKKPISSTLVHIHNEDLEVVPSSNPCSQSDTEDAYLLMKDDGVEECMHDNHLQLDYLPVALKGQGEDFYIEDELVFIDNLAQYAKRLPSLRALLSRLSIFQVQDPLLNSEGENITEEDIFSKCFTFEMKEPSQDKGKEPYEDICKVVLSDEEALVLPIDLPCSYKTPNLKLNAEVPTCLALKSLLEITPEVLADETYKIDLGVKVASDMEISKYCFTEEICASQSRSLQECSKPANDTSFCLGELEVPLTPPCKSEKMFTNSLPAELQLEPVSPFSKSILITEATKQNLEGLVWQSEKYQNPLSSFLLPEHQMFVPTRECLPVTELKKKLSIQEDTSVISSLEENELINLKERLAVPCVLETLSSDLEGGKMFINVETFPQITAFQSEEWLKEKHTAESSGVPDSGGTKDPCCSPVYNENVSSENNAREDGLQSETDKPVQLENQEERKRGQVQPMDWQAVSVEPNRASGVKQTVSFELPRKRSDDFDLLSSFIMLRSKHLKPQSEETNSVVNIPDKVSDAKEKSPVSKNQASPVSLNTAVCEQETKENDITFIHIKPSESQFQAYNILETTVAPVLKELTSLGIHNWRFATLNFDDTRFFLKQQEKMINDAFKQCVMGTTDEKDIALFKHAAVLHLVVTVRDLLLTCSLNTALGYLSKVKDRYKDFVGSSLDNLCRLLTIVQLACQKKLEANPKTTELQHQMVKWMQSKTNEQNKVVIVTRMDYDDETADLINAIGRVQGLEVVYMNSEKKGTLLESKNIINRLKRCSCVVVYDQNIGPDFPWINFSLVVEYNYSKNSCWINVCKNLKLAYIAFITLVPEAVGIALEEVSPDDFGHILLELQIPYVFLTSEGLLNTPEILQLLESKYNITFIERSCCEALRFFGSTDRYVVITIDECTAVIMQNIEELNYEKSSDNVVLRLMVLSLQYTCCWIILYSRARLNSEYSLAGNILHHLSLIYAALVPFSQKSEGFEVKVVLIAGLQETALLVRQIADCVLKTSKRHPQEWLDKSWLSVLPSEAEECLLTFPCVNPLVAQVMLKKSLSLEWLLSATFDQLQELLPEVPEKVLKHFSDITSLYTLNPPTEPELQKRIVKCQEKMNPNIGTCSPAPKTLFSSVQENSLFAEYSGYFNEVQNTTSASSSYYKKEPCIPLKPNGRHSAITPLGSSQGKNCSFEKIHHGREAKRQHFFPFLKDVEVKSRENSLQCSFGEPTHNNFEEVVPTLGYNQGGINTCRDPTKGNIPLRNKNGSNLDAPDLLKAPPDQDLKSVLGVRKQPLMKQHKSSPHTKPSWYLNGSRENFLFQQSSVNFLEEFGGTGYNQPGFQFEERFLDDYQSAPAPHSSQYEPNFCKSTTNSERFFNVDFQIGEEYTRKRLSLSSSNRRQQDTAAGLELTQLPQLKKRRLTFEKDPGRSDGQTRLKFL
ncbi:protein shortage in chiasmata 1 ortholog isoform X2 [Paroedura picta]